MTGDDRSIREITTVDDHARLLSEPMALLYLWFPWSGPARLGYQAVHDWHARWHLYCRSPVMPLYMLDGDQIPELFDWLADTLQETGGFGSIYFLKHGEVALRVPSVLDFGLTALSKACDELQTPK